jgi:hypothetical protein
MAQEAAISPTFSRLFLALLLAGCGSSSSPPATMSDAAPDLAAPGPDAGADASADATATMALTGTIKDQAGVTVLGAKVVVAGLPATPEIFSDAQGKYTAPVTTAGPTMVTVTRDWFEKSEGMVTIAAAGPTSYDVTLVEKPLKIDPADRALAETHAKTFDWTKSTLSVAVVAKPTRRDFDNGVYFHNPALYRDTSKMAALVPAPAPEIAAGVAKGFSFQIKTGAKMGQEVLDLTTIADAIKDTPLGATEPAEWMLWTPMINWLNDWDTVKAAELVAVAVAVRQQNWGGNAIRPQDLEKVYFDAQGNLWVKVVFASFVQLGPSINDDDGDGLKEVYAKIAAGHYSKELADKLSQDYGKTLFTAHGLSKEITRGLRDLYSTTGAQVERTLGQPFEVMGLGTFAYPTLVLRHAGGQKNVFLVAPSP